MVDASVAIKWFVPEQLSVEAAELLEGTAPLLAPDLLMPEVGNVLWKKVVRRELRATEAREILQALRRVPLKLVPSTELVESALEIATRFRRTVYDGMYVALAVAAEGVMVTADERLANAMAGGPLSRYVQRLGAATQPVGSSPGKRTKR